MINEKGMELPIAVMIVFFVSITVALIVINFAGQIISLGEAELKEFSIESDKADFFVETSKAGNNTIAMLANQCYRNNKGTYSGNRICYIVHAIEENVFSEPEVVNKFLELNQEYEIETMGEPINFEDWIPGQKTIYVIFDEITQTIAIES